VTQWLSDRLLGISTARKEKVHRLDLSPEVARHAHDYEPSPYGVLPDALLTIPLEPAETTFVDVGAGKGRVLAEALHHGFRRVIGLEASTRLVRLAKENLRGLDGVERAEVLEVDATAWSLPDEPLVVYLFNPFGHAAHDRFAAQVELRIRRCDAPLWVVHHQPEHRDAWARAPSLRGVEYESRRMILRGPG
jgi:SAM-dependent methyltransferase